MKIIVDQNVPLAEELFGNHGDVVFVNGRDIAPEVMADANALVCRSVTEVNKSLLDGSSVEFVGSCTIGTDHLDVSYLDTAGVSWAHAAGCNAQSVAEYVVSALSALGSVRSGLSAGIIGCGHVGSKVFQELEKLGMRVQGYDPFLQQDAELKRRFSLAELDDVLAADVLCFHTPLTRSGDFPTHRMIGEKELLRLNANAILISAGRGGVIREQALLSVAKQRPDIRWVLDVWENEPRVGAEMLNTATIATPHIAGYSLEGKQNGSWQIYQAFCEHFGFTSMQKEQVLNTSARYEILEQAPLLSIEEVLLSIYDPRQDDLRMRAALNSASEEALEAGTWFDDLRKNYPVRRERDFYRFSLEGLREEQRSFAKALGIRELEKNT